MSDLQIETEKNFIRFTFSKITTEMNKDNIEKKKPIGLPKWRDINKDNYKSYINNEHKGHAIITGKESNLSVIDFDDSLVYDLLMREHPELTTYKTIKTNKGYHIYFLYDKYLNDGVNCFKHPYNKIDIKNDGGMIFAPPTKYKLKDGSTAEYKDLGGNYYNVPSFIKDLLKINNIEVPKTPKNKIKTETKNTEIKIVKDESVITKLIKCYTVERASNYESWFNCLMAIKNEQGNEGMSNFLDFSKLSSTYDQAECIKKYNDFKADKKEKILKLGSLIKWAKMDNKKLFEETIEKDLNNDENLYIQYKIEFEQTFFKLLNPLCYCRETNAGLQFLKPAELREYLKDSNYKFENPKLDFCDLWSKDSNKRKKEKIVFDPESTDDTVYNLFKGFKYDDESVDDLVVENNSFIELLKHVCVDETIYENMLDWISNIIQNPKKKTEWAVVLYSKIGGVGKNAIIDTLFKLFNAYSGKIESIEDITKNFNAHLSNKLFIFGDEINANAKKIADQLKAVITRKQQVMEKKGIDSIIVDDYSNYIFTTNNEHCFKIDEKDRRYYMIKCTEERKNDAFFNQYYEDVKDDYKIKQLFKFFKNRTIKYTKHEAPNTEYKTEMMIEQKPSYIQMIYNKSQWFGDKKLNTTKLYDLSVEYAKKKYLSTNYSQQRFAKDIQDIIGDFKKKSHGVMVFVFPPALELKKYLFEKDEQYYRYINGFDATEDINFNYEGDDELEDKFIFSNY